MDKLFSYAISEWLNDIKKNQLPGILGGVGPMHSLVQLGKLILISIQAHMAIVLNEQINQINTHPPHPTPNNADTCFSSS